MFLGCKSIEFSLQKHCYKSSKAMLLADTYPPPTYRKEKSSFALSKEKSMIIAKLMHNWSILFIFVEYIIKNKEYDTRRKTQDRSKYSRRS